MTQYSITTINGKLHIMELSTDYTMHITLANKSTASCVSPCC